MPETLDTKEGGVERSGPGEGAIGRLDAVQRLTEAGLAYLDLDDLLEEVLQRVVEILEVDTAAVLLVEDDGETLAARAASGLEEGVEQGFRLPIGKGFAGRIAATQSPVAIPDLDDRLFERIFSVVRPGGRFSAQCGGTGNVEEWTKAVMRASAKQPYVEHLRDFHPWNFVSPEETSARLGAAGFEDVKCWLLELTPYEPPDPRDFVAVVGLAAHHERLPEELREPFVDAVVGELPEDPMLRYIRLNLDATRPE